MPIIQLTTRESLDSFFVAIIDNFVKVAKGEKIERTIGLNSDLIQLVNPLNDDYYKSEVVVQFPKAKFSKKMKVKESVEEISLRSYNNFIHS